nr:hypothetical protein [uncultured Rhodopila sp.]
MATKARRTAKKAPAGQDTGDFRTSAEAYRHIENWFKDFDARMADLTARQDALLYSLGLEPTRHRRDRAHERDA